MLGATYNPQILKLMVLSSQKGPKDANLNVTGRFLLLKPWGQEHDLPQTPDVSGEN